MKRFTLLFACSIILNSISAQVTYKDVAGTFYSRCTSCHHEGGAGPFPFMNYSQTIQQSIDIYDALTTGTMPPWSPDTSYTRFLHERIITDSEKTNILNWLTAGAPAGDTTLAPPPPVYSGYQLNGTPTMVLQIPTFTSNATSDDSYVCFSLPTNLLQDQYIRAFEVVPGNASIVHHVLLNVDTIGNTVNDLSGTCYTLPGDYGLGGFAPGAPPTIFPGQAPMKLGIRIKAGSRIVLQMHFPAGSAGQQDSTKIRLYFYPVNETGIRPVSVYTLLQNWSLYLPPAQVSTFSAAFPAFPLDLTLLSTFPHSHKVCTSIVNYAFNATDTIPIIKINDWDFEWQGYYSYRYPVKIPAGYSWEGVHVYDNTVNNPNNPFTPPQLVVAGTSTTNEMLFDSFQFTYYLPGDETVNLETILSNDSLLSGMPTPEIDNNLISVQVFPNPSPDKFSFRIDNTKGKVVINIVNLYGNKIRQIESEITGSSLIEWDRRTSTGEKATAGIYLYDVWNSNRRMTGKITLLPQK